MPEFPDLSAYLHALENRVLGQRLTALRFQSPFVLRSVEPPGAALLNRKVESLRRLGKRIVFCLEDEFFVVVHLMIAGRFKWHPEKPKINRTVLALLEFESGHLSLTEVSTKKRASIHLVQSEASLRSFDRGGLEVMTAPLERFAEVLRSENHTLKRSLTDPRLFAAIGNAYSDEILHRAKLSPVRLTKTLEGKDIAALFSATREVLSQFAQAIALEVGDGFPEKVTAFRPDMAVHGKFKQPCPICSAPVQRIVCAENETDYCARCQNNGKLLADRSLSRLLKDDWPGTLDALDDYLSSRGSAR
jgi:formamidopyrimidine-DNA glycosylase